ncbi:MAG: putative signal transduction protein containing Nacht domain [Chthonomonadaceae bacterium]|nr:putative signal transduction protein containing Nacht domain [Chthonomonadaceae bacterium]
MEQTATLIPWIQSNKHRFWEERTIRRLLTAHTPETTAILVRSALWSAPGSSDDTLLALISALPDSHLEPMPLDSVPIFGNDGAAEALGQLAAKFPPLQAKMLALLQNDNGYVRGGAARALGYTHNCSAELLEALCATAQDKEWRVRYQALEALARIGQSNDRIVDVCLRAVNDPEVLVKLKALETLGKVKPASEKGKTALLHAAHTKSKRGLLMRYKIGMKRCASLRGDLYGLKCKDRAATLWPQNEGNVCRILMSWRSSRGRLDGPVDFVVWPSVGGSPRSGGRSVKFTLRHASGAIAASFERGAFPGDRWRV